MNFEEVSPCTPKVIGKGDIFKFAELWCIVASSALECVDEENLVDRGVIDDVGVNFATFRSGGTKEAGEGKIIYGRKALYVEERVLECGFV